MLTNIYSMEDYMQISSELAKEIEQVMSTLPDEDNGSKNDREVA